MMMGRGVGSGAALAALSGWANLDSPGTARAYFQASAYYKNISSWEPSYREHVDGAGDGLACASYR